MSTHRIVISPGTENSNYWKDLWNYRGLFLFLAWRDVLVRYKQTAVGIAWSVIRPLITIFAMAFIGWLFSSPVPAGVPRLLFVATATLAWQFFSSSFSEASNSLVANSNLLTKVYFPRLIVPVSTVLVCLVDFIISLVIVFALMIIFQYVPDGRIIFLPLFLLLALLFSTGAGLYFASLNVKYRDFRYVIPFIVQFGLYISPVAFNSGDIYNHTAIPEWVKFIYSLNPLVGVIEGFRWCFFGEQAQLHVSGLLLSAAISILLVAGGLKFFLKTERSFADNI